MKNLNLVPDSFARLVLVIFYIYTLVMAGYCVYSALHLLHNLQVTGLLPFV